MIWVLLVGKRRKLDAFDFTLVFLVAHLGLMERVLAVKQHVHDDGTRPDVH
jgi:hypothetical protein